MVRGSLAAALGPRAHHAAPAALSDPDPRVFRPCFATAQLTWALNDPPYSLREFCERDAHSILAHCAFAASPHALTRAPNALSTALNTLCSAVDTPTRSARGLNMLFWSICR